MPVSVLADDPTFRPLTATDFAERLREIETRQAEAAADALWPVLTARPAVLRSVLRDDTALRPMLLQGWNSPDEEIVLAAPMPGGAWAALVKDAFSADCVATESGARIAKGRRQPSPRAPRVTAGPPSPWVADAMTRGGMLTVHETCAILRMSRRNLYRLIAKGRLYAVKQGVAASARLLIPRSGIASYLGSLEG